MFTNKRPNVEESEEDILALEKTFLENLAKRNQRCQQGKDAFEPAATVVKKSKEKESASKSSTGQLGVLGQGDTETKMDVDVESTSDDETPLEQVPAEHPDEPVLSFCVKERPFDSSRLLAFTGQRSLPKIIPLDKAVASEAAIKSLKKDGKAKGKSLFARSYDATFGGTAACPKVTSGKEESGPGAETNAVVGDRIHPLLAGMTEEDILEEQKKLLEKLDPKLVEFIKSRKNAKPRVDNSEVNMEDVRMEESAEGSNNDSVARNESDVQDEDLPIDPKTVKGFPGMEKVELEKLAWAGLIKDRVKFDKPHEGINARFDFKGMLIPTKAMNDPTTYEKGLHHHGEEMDRPGYTLEELLTLARSTYNQQRCMALNTIGNIYENAHTGMYDLVFEKSLFQLADYMDFVYAIRKNLDEDDKSSINVALQCLSEIVYPWEEEICLDIVCLSDDAKPHPWISTKAKNLKTADDLETAEEEMKDAEILQLDLLEFLIHRSNLLNRLKYFFEREGLILNENGVQGALKILIRIARHSPNELIKHKALIRLIIEGHASTQWNLIGTLPKDLKGVPLPMALKIIRILADSSVENAAIVYSEFNIFPVIMSFLAYDDWQSKKHIRMVEALIVESFKVWIAFLSHGVATDEYLTFFPVVMKFLTFYKTSDTLNSFDLHHSGHLFSLLVTFLRMKEDSRGVKQEDRHSHWKLVKDMVSFVEQFVARLLAVASSSHVIDAFDRNTGFFSLSKGLKFLTEATKYQDIGLSSAVLSGISAFISSKMYLEITSELRNQSVILMDKEQGHRYPSNFASVKAIRFGGDWNPILPHGYTLSFLTSLFALMKITKSIASEAVINCHVSDYVSQILKCNSQNEEADFFVRFELSFLCELVELYPPMSSERFYLAYKAVSEVPKCCTKLFNRLFMLALNSSCDESDRGNSFKIYGGYLFNYEKEENMPVSTEATSKEEEAEDSCSAKKRVRFNEDAKLEDGPSITKLEFQSWTDKSIGSHWILEPLERIHTIVTSVPNFLERRLHEIETQIRICLQLIEKCLKNYSDFIIQNPKDFMTVYCNVTQVFLLGDPRIYFDETVAQFLTSILQILTTCRVAENYRNKPLFSKQRRAEGLPNMFFDYYPDLLKEYAGNSYFNEVFAAYLTLPLRNPEDSLMKSNFWTMDCVSSIRTTLEKTKVPIEFLTTGIEKDSKILNIYLRMFHSGKITKDKNGFLFEVIKSNLQNSLDQMDDKLRESFVQLKI